MGEAGIGSRWTPVSGLTAIRRLMCVIGRNPFAFLGPRAGHGAIAGCHPALAPHQPRSGYTTFLVTVWLPLLLVAFGLPACADPSMEQEQEIRTSFVTPHTEWAKPYAGGTTRVLFFSGYRNTQAREIAELMQRFDIQADAAYWTAAVDSGVQDWHGGAAGVARIERLIESGAHDVFIFNGVSLDKLPEGLRAELLARVAAGKGLVLVGVDGKRQLTNPFKVSIHPLSNLAVDTWGCLEF
jgi:hypothetical protein